MRRSFEVLRQLYFQVWVHPPTRWLLAGTAVLYPIPYLTGWPWPWLLLLALALFCSMIDDRHLLGRRLGLTQQVSSHFFTIRSLWGWRGVFQATRLPGDCRTLLKTLVRETDVAAILPPGRYRTITHDAVLRRLRSCPNVTILRCAPAYQSDLHGALMAMTGKRCKRCAQRCAAWRANTRTFFYTEFMIE